MKHKECVRRSFIQFALMTVELKPQNTFCLQSPVVRFWSQTKAVTGPFFLRTHLRLVDVKIAGEISLVNLKDMVQYFTDSGT